MNLKKMIAPIAVAGFGLMLTTTSAFAAYATTALNVRSGPGTGYRVVDVLHAGEYVDVDTCRSNGWCRVSHPGRDGWVSSRYLSDDGYDRRRVIERRSPPPVVYRRYSTWPRYHEPQPSAGFSIQFGNGRGSFGFSVNPPREPDCFRRNGRTYCRVR